MKRVLVVVFLFWAVQPMVLFGLETVNLIKDAGFEKDSEVWKTYFNPDGEYDSTKINRQDPDSVRIGAYSGSIDTRIQPSTSIPNLYSTRGYLYQIPTVSKKLVDLDSMRIYHLILYRQSSNKYSTRNYGLGLVFSNPSNGEIIRVWYIWLAPDLDPAGDSPTRKMFPDTTFEEGVWHNLERNINTDLVGLKGLSEELELDSFLLYGYGILDGAWRGQKTFFDGIRLMGYADYDVGIKEILSGNSLEVGTLYAPIARIKNFGRENADSFLVIAEIADGASIIHSDTLPWTLPSDTEDTVTFADFDPPTTGPYTLTVRTFMEPDECDEDDEVSKEIGHSAIAENPLSSDLTLEVRSVASPLRVSFSLPYGKHGTLTLYDASGRRVERMTVTHPGSVELGSALASGVYLVRLEAGNRSISRKAVVLR